MFVGLDFMAYQPLCNSAFIRILNDIWILLKRSYLILKPILLPVIKMIKNSDSMTLFLYMFVMPDGPLFIFLYFIPFVLACCIAYFLPSLVSKVKVRISNLIFTKGIPFQFDGTLSWHISAIVLQNIFLKIFLYISYLVVPSILVFTLWWKIYDKDISPVSVFNEIIMVLFRIRRIIRFLIFWHSKDIE